MITLNDYLTSSGKYPKRSEHKENTPEVRANAEKLLKAVNLLLSDLEVKNVTISSGFRTSDVNAAIANASKKSLHMSGLAVDLKDTNGELDALIQSRDDLLKKYGLWLESPTATPGWTHLDLKDRGKREKNVFIP